MLITDLTPTQRARLAALVPTSVASLRHIQAGRRNASAEMAVAIEVAAAKIGLAIHRETLNSGCRVCAFARQCRKAVG